MTGFVLNMNGFALNMTGFVLTMTRFVQNGMSLKLVERWNKVEIGGKGCNSQDLK